MSARPFNINTYKKQGNIKVFNQFDKQITNVSLHGNIVLSFTKTQLFLSSCGYKTNATKTAINNALKQLKQPYYIMQESFEWYVCYRGQKLSKFTDGMTLDME